MEEKIVYFENQGKENTAELIKLIKERALKRGIKKIVIASTRGDSAREFAKALVGTDIKLVVIAWQYGFKEEQPFWLNLIPELEKQGHSVHFGTMLFHATELYGEERLRLIANLLRTFGEGFKTAFEILLIATDSGKVKHGETVIVAGGSSFGADTAIVATAASSSKFHELHVQEIIAKPK
jgi:hypothetical protein